MLLVAVGGGGLQPNRGLVVVDFHTAAVPVVS